jgi:similar to stage IV sporulation protein
MTDRIRSRAEVRVSGAELWRLLDRCAGAGIRLERIRAEGDFICRAAAAPDDLPALKELAATTGCEIQVLAWRGAKGAARRLRRRRVLLLAAALTAALLWASSLFVWEVAVTDNDSAVPDGEILRALSRQGVRTGAFWPAFRGERIRTGALCRLPELSFLAVNVRAGRAEVTARAAVEPPEIWDPEAPADVSAGRSGVVERITVLAGEPRVRRGDAVTAGQLLIAGTAAEPHARGEVRAFTYYELTAAAPVQGYEKEALGRSLRRYALILGERRINFYRGSGILPPECDKMTKETYLRIENVISLPVKWVTETIRPYSLRETAADGEALRAVLESALLDRLRGRIGTDGEILRTYFTASESGGALTLTLRAECLERIDTE